MIEVAYLGIKGLPSRAGADRVVEAVSRRMPAFGVYPTVYCDSHFSPSENSIAGVELIRLPALSGKYLRSTSQALIAALHALLFRNFDLIHLHNMEASFVLPILRLKYSVVATSHGFAYRRNKWGSLAKRVMQLMEHPFVKHSSVATSVSATDAQELTARFGRLIRHIPNGVGSEYHPDLKSAQPILDQHGLKKGHYFIAVAGRIIPTKGIHLAVEAVNRFAADVPLLIVGDEGAAPEYSCKLREMAGPRIRFQPLITHPNTLYGLMAQSQCLIFPSLYEAMSIVLLESAQLGLPVLSSDLPENRAVLGGDATYFESDNVESLVEKLGWIYQHPDELAFSSQRAAQRVRDCYSWDAIAAQYAEIYHQLARKKTQQRIDVVRAPRG